MVTLLLEMHGVMHTHAKNASVRLEGPKDHNTSKRGQGMMLTVCWYMNGDILDFPLFPRVEGWKLSLM